VTTARHHDAAKLVALGASSLFVGDLFMTWHPTVAHSSGWTGWGIVAGVLALVVIGLVGARVERPLATLLAATACWARPPSGSRSTGRSGRHGSASSPPP